MLTQSDSRMGWEIAPSTGGLQIPALGSEAVGDTTAATLGKKVPLRAALLWHPGDQLCHGIQGTPALPQHPREPSFATAPNRLQVSYKQSWGRSFPFKCWDFTSKIQAQAQLCPSGAACWGAEQSPKRTQRFMAPLRPRDKQHSLNTVL